MAINKKLIHFKTFANFNSLKLSANEANTKYTTGISGTETSGNPDILYQSICFIKDTQQIWTHGLIYNASAENKGEPYIIDLSSYEDGQTGPEIEELYNNLVDTWSNNRPIYCKTPSDAISPTMWGHIEALNVTMLYVPCVFTGDILSSTVIAVSILDGEYIFNMTELEKDLSALVDLNYLATINGQSLLNGGQDITIEGGNSGVFVKFNELFAEGTLTTNESDVFNVVKTAMESNTPLLLCDNNYSVILVSYYPLKVGSQIICSGLLYHDIYNFSFTPNSNQVTVTTSIGATKNESDLVEAQGIVTIDGTTYALPNTDAEVWADDCLLTYDTGIRKYKDYEGYDLGIVEGFYEVSNGYPWALPNSDFSDVVGSEFTLASAGDVPAYYIADETANPLVLRSRDNDTNCYPGKLISIYFAEQFQEDQNQTISINGNEYDLLPTGLRANSGDTLLFVFSDDYIEPVLVSRAKELSTARSINGMNFRGSTNIYNFDVCSTAASTANKIVSINNFTPNYGAQIRVLFDYSNTNAAPTLNVNNTGAKSMKYNGNAITNSNFTFDVNKIYTFTCRDSSWDLEGNWDKGTVTGVKINGTTKNPSNGVVDLGTVITAHQTLKTINGESILGSGNITISGGGGGSSAYSEVNHGTSDRTFTLTPNTFHVWDEMTALTLTLGDETSGVANEYLFQFTSPATPTTLTLPDDIKFSEDLIIEANKIYQISILKGLGSVLSWDNGVTLIENKATYNEGDATVTFQYPVASDLTVVVGMESINISAGEQSYTIKYPEPDAEIRSITPTNDSTYYYTF